MRPIPLNRCLVIQMIEPGAGGGIRTLGLRFTKPLLYH